MRRDANPFELLELEPTASPIEIERQKQKLLGMLELGLDAASRVAVNGRSRERTTEAVREAAELLARPVSRLAWELWTPRTGAARDCLDEALELHAAIARQIDEGLSTSAGELDEVGLAWDLAFESEDIEDRIRERTRDLHIADPDAVLDEFRDELEESLLAMAGLVRGDLDELESEILESITDRHANEIVDRLEIACERYVSGDASLEGWAGLTRLYWDVVKGRGEHIRHTAFYAIYGSLADHAVDLFQAASYEDAAREFRWLSERAEAIGDEEAAVRERENAQLSASAWLRDEEEAREIEVEAESGRGSWSWLWIIAVVVIALMRAGRGCDRQSSPSYTPPPIRLDNIERINRDLQRSLENLETLERYRDMPPLPDLPEYEPLPELPGELETPPETSDDRRTPRPPADSIDP